jgi:DNA-binding MarR family transcriptional regulator
MTRAGDRPSAVDHLYRSMTHLMRRRSELASTFHPELTLVGFSFLSDIEADPGTRATDLAARYGLDKSTVSRQLDQIERSGLLRRAGERPGRRGHSLVVTDEGRAALARESALIHDRMVVDLAGWKVAEISALADLVDRFIEDLR